MRSFGLILGLMWLAAACQYDLDKLYRHDRAGLSNGRRDAGIDAGSGPSVPAHLIDLFAREAFVDEGCRACVNRNCAKAEASCRADQACLDLSVCASQGVAPLNPDKLTACRQEQAAWCAEDMVARNLGGPFYTCAFRDNCAEQCNTSSDWSCLGQYTWGGTNDPSVPLHLRLYDALTGAPAAKVIVTVCLSSDVACVSPSSAQETDDDGVVTLDLPTPRHRFFDHLRIEGEDWFPTIVQFGYPIVRETVVPLPIVTDANVRGSIFISGVNPDETRGLLQLRMYGCSGVPMRDVSFTSSKADADSRTWYYDGQTVQFDSLTKTTTYGNGGIINVGEGLNEVTAMRGGEVVARTNAPVRSGFLTIVLLAPLDSSQSSQ